MVVEGKKQCILLHSYYKFNLVNNFLVPIFSTISEIKDKG